MQHVVLAAFVLAALRGELPPVPTAELHARSFPWSAETAEQRDERYVSVSQDIAAAAALEPDAASQARLAALLVSVAVRESALAPDVDLPECHPDRIAGKGGARGATCDGGRARSVFQLQNFKAETRAAFAVETRAAIGRSRRACARAGLPPEERLAAFASGDCKKEAGKKLSRDREAYAARILVRYGEVLRTAPRTPCEGTCAVVKR